MRSFDKRAKRPNITLSLAQAIRGSYKESPDLTWSLLCRQYNVCIATLSSILRGEHKVLLTSEDKENLLDRHTQYDTYTRKKENGVKTFLSPKNKRGRPPRLSLVQVLQIRKDYIGGKKVKDLQEEYGVSASLLYRVFDGTHQRLTEIMEEEGEIDRNKCFPHLKFVDGFPQTKLSDYEQELLKDMI
jgi:hypothetical protein